MTRATPFLPPRAMALRPAKVPALSAAELAEYFERLFVEYRAAILNYLYRVVGDSATAEDLTQDAFTRAWRARDQLGLVENPRAWLYRIATNAARDHLRRRRLLAWLPLSGEATRHPHLATSSHEEMVLEGERMRQALLKLSPDNRIALVLFTCQECSVAEVAEALGITPEAARQRLVRARRQLREAFE
jgi:RNA polymerase sigma-70 factor (ECF subfamily)